LVELLICDSVQMILNCMGVRQDSHYGNLSFLL